VKGKRREGGSGGLHLHRNEGRGKHVGVGKIERKNSVLGRDEREKD